MFPSSDSTSPASPAVSSFPYSVGSQFHCYCPSLDCLALVEVIERRQIQGKPREYYVHFIDKNRRLDQWVNEQDLKAPDSSLIPSSSLLDPLISHSSSPPLSSPSLSSTSVSFSIPAIPPSSSPLISSASRRLTRRDRRLADGSPLLSDYHDGHHIDATEAELEKEHEEKTKVKNINQVVIGEYEITCWYFSPFPHAYRHEQTLFICQFCLKYLKSRVDLSTHSNACKWRHPPGNEIYRDGRLSVWEVDGDKHRVYCSCLSLLAKLFIDHKTAYYDVEPFLFYILTEQDKDGHQITAYFSKEKHSAENNNVACILTFPHHQRKGYGKFLITLSYALSQIEGKIGSPEKPLSDLGRISYRSYWTEVLVKVLSQHMREGVTLGVEEVSQLTAIKKDDIIATLRTWDLIRYVKGLYVITVTPKIIESIQAQLAAKESNKKYQLFDSSKLQWSPLVFPKEFHRKRNQTNNLNTSGEGKGGEKRRKENDREQIK
jgi:histone acetyltransferase MYST1